MAEEDDSNGRATAGDNSAFLDIVGVDNDYPLVGSVDSPQLPNGQKPADLLAKKDGVWGAIVNPIILDRLGQHARKQAAIDRELAQGGFLRRTFRRLEGRVPRPPK